jgi:hypothetical protein
MKHTYLEGLQRLEIKEGTRNFMFYISVFKSCASAAPQNSKMHQGTTLDCPDLNTVLVIT